MSRQPCPHESALLGRLASGVTASGLDPDLRAHVQMCASCRETMALVQALRGDHTAALSERSLPTASHIWWRARVRSRLEAAHAAERPISLVQSISMAALLGLAASLVGAQSMVRSLRQVLDVAAEVSGADVATALSSMGEGGPLWQMLVAAVCLAVLMPVAAAIALSRD